MGTNSPLSADPFIHKDINYDPIKDFVPITRVGSFTLMLVVIRRCRLIQSRNWSTMPRPIPASYRSPAATPPASSAKTHKQNGEISILHVPYKTTAPASGHHLGRVSMMFADFTSAMPHVRRHTAPAGRIAHKTQHAVSGPADNG